MILSSADVMHKVTLEQSTSFDYPRGLAIMFDGKRIASLWISRGKDGPKPFIMFEPDAKEQIQIGEIVP
jgi:hypothetical protein